MSDNGQEHEVNAQAVINRLLQRIAQLELQLAILETRLTEPTEVRKKEQIDA